jgi:hypothetical protein
VAAPFEMSPDRRTDQTTMTGDVYPGVDWELLVE